MTRFVRLKLALLFVGLAVWAWGYRTDDNTLRLVGIGVLLAAFLLRFLERRKKSVPETRSEPPNP